MKVALLSDCYPPRLGGIESQVRDLARQLAGHGHEVEVFTATPGPHGERHGRRERDAGVLVHRNAIRLPFDLPVNPLAPKAIRADLLRGGFDVAHVHMGVVSPFASDMADLALDLGMPTAITWHCVLSGPNQLVARRVGAIRRWADRGATLTAVSAMAAARVAAVAGGSSVGVLPNGIDAAAWQPAAALDGPHIGPAEGVIRIVTAMRLAPRKRVLPLLRMLRTVRERVPAGIELGASVFGDGPLRRPVRAALRPPDRSWIHFAGRVPREHLARAYAEARVYLAPSRLEAFGIAALEGRTVGLPVVALAGSGVADFVTDDVNGLLAHDDAGLVDAVVRLATDSQLRQRIAAHNRAVPPAQDWSDVVELVTAEYARAATERR